MSGWKPALATMVVWALHFFLAYGLMLIAPDARWVGLATLALGALCFAAIGLIFVRNGRSKALTTAAPLAAIAIVWQSAVGLF